MGLFQCAPSGENRKERIYYGINYSSRRNQEEEEKIMKNTMWHVALEPGKTIMQDVVVADLEFNDFEQIGRLMGTDQLKAKVIETEGGGYMLMYGGEYERPYPNIMIWRYEARGTDNVICDMRMEDARVLEYVWRYWLMPGETDAEYVPPGGFLVMANE